MSVVHIADIKNDNSLITVPQALRMAADEAETGDLSEYKSAVVLLLKDGPDKDGDPEFSVSWRSANIRSSTMIAVMEAAKADLLAKMGYGK